MQKIVGVKRKKDREIYYFFQNIDDLKLGDKIVVNFEDFQTVVTVVKLGMEIEDEKAQELTKIVRRATESDIIKYETLAKKALEYLPQIKKISIELGLVMKFVSAEYSLDNSKILIVFSSEERVDFRQLLKELAGMLKTRIELKQIGQRDEARVCDSVGLCGQQCCCSRFLKEFEHVTVKMAKIQGLSLSPTKINGVCGRLMCCLGYEAPFYEEMVKKMPKVGSEIETPCGLGTVVYNDILREKVSIKRKAEGDTFVVEEFTLEELKEGKRKEPEEKEKNDSNAVYDKIDEIMQKSAELLNEEKDNKQQNLQNNNKENSQKSSENNKNNTQKHQNNNNFAKNGQNQKNNNQQKNYQKNNKNGQNTQNNSIENANQEQRNNTQNDRKHFKNNRNFNNKKK